MHFLGSLHSKKSALDAGGLGSIPGSGRSLEKGMAIHSSILAWRIPWTEKPGGLQSMKSQRVGHNWMTNTYTWPHRTEPGPVASHREAEKSLSSQPEPRISFPTTCGHQFISYSFNNRHFNRETTLKARTGREKTWVSFLELRCFLKQDVSEGRSRKQKERLVGNIFWIHPSSAQSCPTFATSWAVTQQASLSMGFFRQEQPSCTESSWPRDWTRVSCIAGGFFTTWAIREAFIFWKTIRNYSAQ